MFSKIILVPFVLITGVLLYMAYSVDAAYAPWIIPFLVAIILTLVLGPQIDWWWYSRHPRDLSPEMTAMLERFSPFYNRLNQADRVLFRNRVDLFMMGNDWTPMEFPEDKLPPDLQLMIAAQAVSLTLRKPSMLLHRFEKVILYPTAFLSPEYPFPHAAELHENDGCLIFSADTIARAFLNPGGLYNVALHEYAKAFVLEYPGEPYPVWEDPTDLWTRLEQTSGMSRAHVESVIGLAGIDALPVAIHHFFLFTDRFKSSFPVEAQTFEQIFFKPGVNS